MARRLKIFKTSAHANRTSLMIASKLPIKAASMVMNLMMLLRADMT